MTDTRVGEYGRAGRTFGQWWDWEGPYATVSVPELHDFCRRAYLCTPYFCCIMLHPTGLRKDLREFFLSNGNNISFFIKNNGT